MSHAATRRSFIAGASMIAVAPLAAQAATTTAGVTSPCLARAIALHRKAEAAWDRFYAEVEKPAQEAFAAAMDAYPDDPEIPHEEVATTFVNIEGKTIRLSTAKHWLRGAAEKVVNDPTWADMGDADWRRAHREVHEAFKRRDFAEGERAGRKAAYEREQRKRLSLTAIYRRSDKFGEQCVALLDVVQATPPTSLHDLAVKAAYLIRHGGEPSEHDAETIFADIARLAGGSAAA